MLIRDISSPTLAELRPGRESRAILPGLADALLATGPPPTAGPIPYALATLSAYAYGDEDSIGSMATRLGLASSRCRLIEEEIDVMFIRSTAYLIQSEDGQSVILVYRGTSPTSAVSWLGDLDIDPEKVAIEFDGVLDDYRVHRGFYRNVRSTSYKVMQGLRRALAGLSITEGDDEPLAHPMRALYLAGHSLGGAQATLAAILLRSNSDENAAILAALRGVYTFGAPMVCDPRLAQLCDRPEILGERLVRYVYGSDVVPQLPPKASGTFEHFGLELHHESGSEDGPWTERKATGQLRNLLLLGELVPSFLARQLTVLRRLRFDASLSDHLPQHYVAALAPEGIRSEFGD